MKNSSVYDIYFYYYKLNFIIRFDISKRASLVSSVINYPCLATILLYPYVFKYLDIVYLDIFYGTLFYSIVEFF